MLQNRLLVLFLVLTFAVSLGYAQPPDGKPARILFLVDASGSMSYEWHEKDSRFKAATRIIGAIMDSMRVVNNDVTFAVRVFGAQYPAEEKNCFDSKLEVGFRPLNQTQIMTRFNYIRPRGYSPIAWSLKETAEKDFREDDYYAYSLILITDGGESCGGDICETVTTLLAKKISFRPYILSLIDYAPLKAEFECLGTYMSVTRPADIAPAIHRIIDDNRQILSVKDPRQLGLAANDRGRERPRLPPAPAPRPEKIAVEQVPASREPLPLTRSPQGETTPRRVPALPLSEFSEEPPSTVVLKKLMSLSSPAPLPLLTTGPALRPRHLPSLPPLNLPVEAPEPAPAPTARTAQAPASSSAARKTATEKTDERLTFDVQSEDAAATSLKVYFTDGKGTFYRTEPEMIIKNASSGQKLKSAYRNVIGGEPVPIELPAGTYDIEIPGSESAAHNVVIEANKTNKVFILAGQGSLAFHYPTNQDRPVREYRALVSKRFEGGEVITQPCDEVRLYDPTNYHIEINTLPPLSYNIDLAFNAVKVVAVPEPGTIKITNTANMGKVQFWYERGNRFVPFHEMQVMGDPARQQEDFLPGKYQVRYFKRLDASTQKVEIIPFDILRRQTTEIFLPE